MSRDSERILEDNLKDYASELNNEIYRVEEMIDYLVNKRERNEKRRELQELEEQFEKIKGKK